MEHTKAGLKQMQSLPLSAKILMTKRRIKDWYDYFDGQVYVAFSGGKDSTVLLHLAREVYSDIEAVFVNTGLEYPEIQMFVKTFDNVTILRPKMRFDEVIKKYGYPLISKSVSNCVRGARLGQQSRINLLNGKDCDGSDRHSKFSQLKYKPLLAVDFEISEMCCDVMKKSPCHTYTRKTGKKPILATMAQESMLREKNWIKYGCNAFDAKHKQSAPMSFWTEQDVLQYIKQYNVPIASVYGNIVYKDGDPNQIRIGDYLNEYAEADNLATTGCNRTGCIFCAFGCHLEKEPSRFQRLKETHPRQYEYCINGGEYDENGVWKPSKEGLGMGHVFDELNKIYGDGFIKY